MASENDRKRWSQRAPPAEWLPVQGHPRQDGCQYRGTPSRMAASIGYELGVSFPLHASPFTTIKCQAADWGSEMFLGPLSPQIYNTFLWGHLKRWQTDVPNTEEKVFSLRICPASDTVSLIGTECPLLNSLVTVSLRSRTPEKFSVYILAAVSTFGFSRVAAMKLNHRDICRCNHKTNKWMTCKGGRGGVGWWWLTFRILKGGEVEWLAQERTHGSHSVRCESSPKGNTRSNMPHNLIFWNFLSQIHANYTISKTQALGFHGMVWCASN